MLPATRAASLEKFRAARQNILNIPNISQALKEQFRLFPTHVTDLEKNVYGYGQGLTEEIRSNPNATNSREDIFNPLMWVGALTKAATSLPENIDKGNYGQAGINAAELFAGKAGSKLMGKAVSKLGGKLAPKAATNATTATSAASASVAERRAIAEARAIATENKAAQTAATVGGRSTPLPPQAGRFPKPTPPSAATPAPAAAVTAQNYSTTVAAQKARYAARAKAATPAATPAAPVTPAATPATPATPAAAETAAETARYAERRAKAVAENEV